MITAENLTRKFKDITAVENISFDINESEIFGFLGPNGAGKTTTIRMLSTLISPDSGKITIDNKDSKIHGEYIRTITGLLTESPGMYEKISAYDNLKYYSSFYNIPDHKINNNIEKYLKMFDLWDRKDDIAGTYSKGMKQKLALSRALIHEPKILLLDEPTAGLDPESAHMVRNFIDSLKKEKTTVFLCTHNLEEASNLSDRVCIIKKKVIRIATLSELQSGERGKRAQIVFSDDADRYVKLMKELSEIKNIQTDKNKATLVIENPDVSNPKVIKKLLKSDCCAKGFKLPGFSGILKQADTRLGKEFAVHARIASGIGGIIHSDELPGYGIKTRDVEKIQKILNTEEYDAFVIAIGKEAVVDGALQTVLERSRKSLDGVQEEVRRALPDGTTEYMRPRPGAARMYPETDVPPVRITCDHLQQIKEDLPERPEERRKRFMKEYKLNVEQTKQVLSSGYENDFERLVKQFPDLKNIIIRTFLNTFSELENDGINTDNIDDKLLIDVFSALSNGKYAKEAVPEILRYLLQNKDASIDKAVETCGLSSTDKKDIVKIVKRIVSKREEFIKKRGTGALGPLMGIVMKELRGKADGKVISKILNDEIQKIISS